MKIIGFTVNKNKENSALQTAENNETKPKSKRKERENKIINIAGSIIIVGMLLVLSSFTLNFNSQFVFGSLSNEAIYNGNRNSNHVSLMVNVYWGTEYIPDMLAVFKAHEVKTTFFIGGQWAEKEPEMLKQLIEEGHEIGNHGYFHRDHDKLNADQNREEISNTHKLVKTFTGLEMSLFAPPSGAFNKTTLEVAESLGYKTIMWSKDTIDWRDKNTDLIFTRATKNVKGGDLILMHPTQDTLATLPRILDYYKQNNLIATTVSSNLLA